MSSKAKSELSFILKILILFIILFANKLYKPDHVLVMDKSETTDSKTNFVMHQPLLKQP